MSPMRVVMAYALREGVRRRVFPVVLVLSILFLVFYALGAALLFGELEDYVVSEDERAALGTGLLAFGMFVILFLGTVLGIFLTIGIVKGDAERGLLQPLVVRPLGRTRLLAARFAAAALTAGGYTLAFYLAAMLVTAAIGDWLPDQPLLPALALTGAVIVIAAVSLLGSVFLSPTANGIAVFMLFGAGLSAVILRTIADAFGSEGLKTVVDALIWLLPFEPLYFGGIEALNEDAEVEEFLGVFQAGPGSYLLAGWTAAYVTLLWVAARGAFARRDL